MTNKVIFYFSKFILKKIIKKFFLFFYLHFFIYIFFLIKISFYNNFFFITLNLINIHYNLRFWLITGKRSGSFDCGSDDDNSAMSFRRIQSSTSVTNVNFCETSKVFWLFLTFLIINLKWNVAFIISFQNSNCTGSVPAINLSFSPNLDRTQSQQSQDLDKSLTKNIGNAGHSLGLASNTHFTSDDNMDELIGLCSGKFTNSLGSHSLT